LVKVRSSCCEPAEVFAKNNQSRKNA
jgi:hypothetical protein